MNQHFDVIVVGGGPGGSVTALAMAESGAKIAIIDKAEFPRDKVCGDGLTHDCINQLDKLPLKVRPEFEKIERKQFIKGFRMVSNSGRKVEFPWSVFGEGLPCYVVRREDFDTYLFRQAQEFDNVTTFEKTAVKTVKVDADKVTVNTTKGELTAKIIVGADGAHSVVAKQLANSRVDKRHYCAGVRAYHQGIEGMHPDGYLEVLCFPSIAGGYFWIFPLENGNANVGLGMLSNLVQKRRVNLKKELENITESPELLGPRFENAERLENIKGMGLPLGSIKRPLSGNRFILVGDAGGLIDPLTGEGIANAIRSGRYAGEHLKNALAADSFSAQFNKQYDKALYKALWPEFRLHRWVQLVFKSPTLVNLVVNKMSVNPSGKKLMDHFVFGKKIKWSWINPWFYVRFILP